MKKIILIEDKFERQKSAFERHKDSFDIGRFSGVLENAVEKQFNKYFKMLKDSESDIWNAPCLLIHNSAIRNHGDIENHIRSAAVMSKWIILFSGDYTGYSSINNTVRINVDLMYKNLKEFLEYYKNEAKIEPKILKFGSNWQLDSVLRSKQELLQLAEQAFSENETIPQDDVVEHAPSFLDSSINWSNVISELIDQDELSKQDVGKILSELDEMIDSMV